MPIGRFYAGVAALIRRPTDGRYLLLQRSAGKDFTAGAWESVTSRVDQGEGFPQAVRREAREELGVDVRIDFIVGTMHFYRGAAQPENELVGVQFGCSLEVAEPIRLSAEHTEYRWVTAAEAEALLPEGHWLRRAIRRAEALRAGLPPVLLERFRTEGFEQSPARCFAAGGGSARQLRFSCRP
jgi:8-oxo-dGTP pyrophosphatase MutT (NUDIX family)